jgi:hypothetical protein
MSLEPLASPTDVEARVGRSFTTDERAQVARLLLDASAKFRQRSTQRFTPGTSTVKLKVNGCRARLPQRPVTAVTSVVNLAGLTVPFTWLAGTDELLLADLSSSLYSFEYVPFRVAPSAIVVEYDHGSEEVPDAVVGVVCQLAARAFGRSAEQAGITQENIDGYSYSTLGAAGAAAASGAFGMLASELEVADAYRRSSSPIATLP